MNQQILILLVCFYIACQLDCLSYVSVSVALYVKWDHLQCVCFRNMFEHA